MVLSRGRVAQLGEHLPYKQGVAGSSPVPPTSKAINRLQYFVHVFWGRGVVG